MRIRFRWIVVLALLAGVSWWNHDHWREAATEWLLELRAQRFRADAEPKATYRVPRDGWVSFRLATNATQVRVLTTAVLRQEPSLDRLQLPRWSGWRYALEYELLAADGSLLQHDEYHFRADLKQYRQPDTGEVFSASFFSDSFRVPVQTRSLQLRLDHLGQTAGSVRLRLLDHEPEIGDVVARVLCRRPRPGYKKSNTWSRLSKRRRERLCRASVYPPDLLKPREKEKLLRWEWTPGTPVGIADVDYLQRRMYTIEEIVGDEVGDEILPAGSVVEREHRATIPVPEPAGVVTLEIECVERPDNEPLQIEASWFGLGSQRPTIRRLTVRRPVESVSMPVEGGLIEVDTNGRVVVRSAWRPDESGGTPRRREQEDHSAIENAATPIDISPEPQILLTCVADKDQTIAYSLCHPDGQPTPFCVALRSIDHSDVRTLLGFGAVRQRQERPHPATPLTDQSSAGDRVTWTLLDEHGSPIDTGSLQADEPISKYDRVRVARDTIPVSEPAVFYFLVPADVASIEFAAATPVLLAAYTRPPGLAKRTQVPEDYHPYHRERSLRRSWFFLRPQAYSKLIAEGRTLAVHLQPRPPQRNEDLLAGRYLWEDFRPAGFWKGRHLLVPQETHVPLRDEALPSTHWEFPVNREHQVRFVTNPGCRTVQSRLIYVTEQPATLSLRLDDDVWMTKNLRSSCGEIELPPRLADQAWHRLVIQADKPARVFLRNVRSESAPRFLKRLAPTIVDGRLRFSITKRSEDEELLMLRLYQTANQAGRVPLRVRLQTARRRIPGPTRSWTLADRIFDLRRDATSATLVLGSKATVDTGRVCYVSLGADMPPGLYSVDVERLGESEGDEYVVLYRTVPGVTARRRVYVEESPVLVDRSGRHLMLGQITRRGPWSAIVVMLAVGLVLWPAVGHAETDSLESLLTAASKDCRHWPPDADELRAAERLFMETMRLSDVSKDLRQQWATLGWILAPIRHDDRSLIVLYERAGSQRGRGFFAFRPGAESPVALQAPHSFYDRHTRRIALRLFLEAPFAAVAWNTVRRSTVDAAHTNNHYINAFTRAFVQTQHDATIVQIHGFAREKRHTAAARNAHVIVSNSTRFPSRLARDVSLALRTDFDSAVCLYPIETGELGGTTNSQARTIYELGFDGFLHLEMSRQIRDDLRNQRNRRKDFIKSLSSLFRF